MGVRRGLNTPDCQWAKEERRVWRYWQVDLLLERGRDAEAKNRFVARTARFYRGCAARRLRLGEGTLKIDKRPPT